MCCILIWWHKIKLASLYLLHCVVFIVLFLFLIAQVHCNCFRIEAAQLPIFAFFVLFIFVNKTGNYYERFRIVIKRKRKISLIFGQTQKIRLFDTAFIHTDYTLQLDFSSSVLCVLQLYTLFMNAIHFVFFLLYILLVENIQDV